MALESDGKRKSKRRVVKWAILGFFGLVVALFFARGLIVASDSSDRATCKNNLKQIVLALLMYVGDHEGEFPPGETAAQVFTELIEAGYLKDGPMGKYHRYPVYVCPGAKQEVKEWKRTGKLTEETCSYEWVGGLKPDSDLRFMVCFDKSPDNHWTRLLGITLSGGKGRNVLFVDGHVSWIGEESFQERMEWQMEMLRRMEEGGDYVDWYDWRDEKGGGDARD